MNFRKLPKNGAYPVARRLHSIPAMLAHVYAAALNGIEAVPVKVEVDVQPRGLPGWSMVGLLEMAVKEARDRVGPAIRNSGYPLPNRRTIINLSPADLKKSGSHYDLAIAIGLLAAVNACRINSSMRYMIAGELSLTGKVLPVDGALLMSLAAAEHGLDGIIVPSVNAREAMLAGSGEVIAVNSLSETIDFLNTGTAPALPQLPPSPGAWEPTVDFSEVRGQPFAKRGLEIAAAGAHNIAMKGPPGTGKTMLAERLPTILPPLGTDESKDVAKIYSWHGLLKDIHELPRQRPFRAPHHCASYAGLVGGTIGAAPRLGEISLAHNGVLFLDEMAEFRRDVLEALRQPLESGEVRIVRAGASIRYPARFMLACAFNPCRCGYYTHPTRACICTVPEIRKYRQKLSGPLLDRIDLHIEVGPPPHEALIEVGREETSSVIRQRVIEARKRQEARYGKSGRCNAHLSGREVKTYCKLGRSEKQLLKLAADKHQLSARSLHRVLKVARTIADLAGKEDIATEHIAEALQFRPSLDDIV